MKKTISAKINTIKDMDTLNEVRSFIDTELNTRKSIIELCNKANDIEGKPFGYLKEAMEDLSVELFKTGSGRKLIKEYKKEIKDREALHNIYGLYESLNKLSKDSDVYAFLNDWGKITGKISRKELNEGNRSLGKIVSKAYIMAGSDADSLLPDKSKLKFYESVEYVASKKASSSNLGDIFSSIKVIENHVRENVPLNENALQNMISDFDSKYSENLTEEELRTIDRLTSEGNEENCFDFCKNECLACLNEAKTRYQNENDFDTSGRIELYIENINKKKFNKETIDEDIQNLIELSKCFE